MRGFCEAGMTNEYKERNDEKADEKRPEDAAERWDRDFVRELHAIRRPKILKRIPGLNNGEVWILGAIWGLERERQMERIRVSELVKMMHCPAPAVSRQLKSLESRSFILRETDPEDRRNTLVSLTDAGIAKAKEMEACLNEFARGVYERMGAEDMEELIRLLRRLRHILEEEEGRWMSAGRNRKEEAPKKGKKKGEMR